MTKIGQNDQNLAEMTKSGPKWSKLGPNDQNGQHLAEMAKLGRNGQNWLQWPKLG